MPTATAVHRALLCGEGHSNGDSYEHRKERIVNRTSSKSCRGVFAIDVSACAALPKHCHTVLFVDRYMAEQCETDAEKDKGASEKSKKGGIRRCHHWKRQGRARHTGPTLGGVHRATGLANHDLPFHFPDDLELADGTGRIIWVDKRDQIREGIPPILQRLGVEAESWINSVRCLGRHFYNYVDPPQAMGRCANGPVVAQLPSTLRKTRITAERTVSEFAGFPRYSRLVERMIFLDSVSRDAG